MTNDSPAPANSPRDHGTVVARPRRRLSWAWLFPVLGACAAGWLFWTQWRSNGPEITIQFDEAPGLDVGKTALVFRGVDSGHVTGLRLDEKLNKVVVNVRLKEFAAGLARAGTVFWIDRPVIKLGQTTGLEALIQGNSLQARMGTGPPATSFVGVEKQPLTPLEAPSLVVRLRAPVIPFLDRGTPVYYRGVAVGVVEDKALDDKHIPYLQVVIDKDYAHLVHTTSRFWSVPAASVDIGNGGAKVDVAGLQALMQGGIAFETIDASGPLATHGQEFFLSPSEELAHSSSSPIKISFDDGQGLHAQETRVCYLGQPVGIVDDVQADPSTATVITTVRFRPGFEKLQRADTVFTLIRPHISLKGITGLETIFGGVYIACQAGSSTQIADSFTGHTMADEEWNRVQSENTGITITLWAKDIPSLGVDTPILFHGIAIGRVKEKVLDEQQQPVLHAVIRKEFAAAIQRNACFWRVPATSLRVGSGVAKVDVESLEALLQGSIAFDVFTPPAGPAGNNARFELFADERTARSGSPPIHIRFDNGQGLLAGVTQLRYLGLPVGVVEEVHPTPGKVQVVARLENGYDFLRSSGSVFAIVRPQISLQGISGLETLVSGVFIDCIPASSGSLAQDFVGRTAGVAAGRDNPAALEVVVTAPTTKIGVDAPVYYRGVPVGKVTRKTLAADGRSVGLIVAIDQPFAALVRKNSQFWDISGMSASLHWFSLVIATPPVGALLHGGLAFATPNNPDMGPRARRGTEFPLNSSPRSEWLRWEPTVPLEQ